MNKLIKNFMMYGGILIFIQIFLTNFIVKISDITGWIMAIIIILVYIIWAIFLVKTLKEKRYVKDEKTGYVMGMTYKDVARHLDNNTLIRAIKRMSIFIKITPLLFVITVSGAIYGFYVDIFPIKISGIGFTVVVAILFFTFKRVLGLYKEEGKRRNL